MRELGVEVTTRPFELHPAIPTEGMTLQERWGPGYGRARAMYDRVAAECEAVGLPFRVPERIPNTRRVLETAEFVRRHSPDAFDALDESLFRAHFADGLFLGDPDVLDSVVTAAGADATAARAAVDDGQLHDVVTESMTEAYELGIAATPTWVIDGAIVPGLQSRDFFTRVVQRLKDRRPED